MTVATLEQLLTVPEHPAAEWGERYGYYEETVHGRRRYVTKDHNNRAVVGPKRHRARGLLSLGRKKHRTEEQPGTLERYITPGEALEHAFREASRAVASIPHIRLPYYPPTSTPPQEKPSMAKRIRTWCTDKFYDEEWHKGAQRTAMTVMMWAFTLAALVVFAKGALWLVTL